MVSGEDMATAKTKITRIQSYTFGRITIASRVYTSDVIIWPENVKDRWWRRTGHSLSIEDLEAVLHDPPQCLLIGQGANGLMNVPDEIRNMLKEKEIELLAMPTVEAVNLWNRWIEAEGANLNAVAALHLTC